MAPEMRPGDWMCPSCNNHNYASKVACNKCGIPNDGAVGGQGFAPALSPYVSQLGGKGREMRAGDWMCPSCNNHNFADKMLCNKCGVPKSAAMQPCGGKGGYGKVVPPTFQFAPSYGKGSPYAGGPYGGVPPPPPPAGNGMRPGDWMCPSCSNHNYADKVACNRCQAPKAVHQQMIHQPMMHQPMVIMGGAQGGGRPGDWNCRACGNINYASREQCNKCQVPKTTFISKSGMRAGDWVCPACTNHNWADKTSCVKCGELKTEQSVHQIQKPAGNMRPGDWLCVGCNNHNYQNRVVCNRCQQPKPAEAEQSFGDIPSF